MLKGFLHKVANLVYHERGNFTGGRSFFQKGAIFKRGRVETPLPTMSDKDLIKVSKDKTLHVHADTRLNLNRFASAKIAHLNRTKMY